jgi:hypothetical protein
MSSTELGKAVATLQVRTDQHAAQLDAHGRILQTLTEQASQHSAMLMKHADLHTKHAEAIVAAKEVGRVAMQSTSDLAQEFRNSMASLGQYLAENDRKRAVEAADTEKRHAQDASEFRAAIKRLAGAQEQMAIQSVASGQAMQTLARWQNHPLLKIVGAIIGAAIASYLAARGH